jgi:hypothetical protein
VNYARRQQYRRLSRASVAASGSTAALLLALVVVSAGAKSLAAFLFLAALGLGFYARRASTTAVT